MQSIIYISDYRNCHADYAIELCRRWEAFDWSELWKDEEIAAESSIVELTNEIDKDTLLKLAESPSVSERTLATLAFNPEVEVRQAVADHQRTPYRTLMMLVNDESVDVRYHLAGNYSIPDRIIRVLVDDENPYVMCRAIATLERKRELDLCA